MQINDTSRVSLILSRKAIRLLLVVYTGLVILWLMTPDQRRVALPSMVIAVIAIGALIILKRREGVFPLFELGTMAILITATYALIPPLGYLLSGLTWTVLSDNRLLSLDLSPAQVGRFAWWNVGYLLSFAAVYLHQRGRSSAQGVSLEETDPLTAMSMVVLTIGILIYLILLYVVTGANYWFSYEDLATAYASFQNLPLLVNQVSSHLFGIYTMLKLGLVILLVQHWRQKRWRYVLFLWLGAETAFTLVRMGPRHELVFLLLGSILVYHRLIKPLRISKVALLGGLILCGALVYGGLRSLVMAKGELSLTLDKSIFSMINEFQVLLGTAADLQDMKMKGLLGEVPLAAYFADLLALIPQQLLPITKVDPAQWYLEKIGQKEAGAGFMFGVMSQGVIGWGWLELVLRGALLGYLFAAVHRWYVQHAENFWMTFFYLWMCLFSYYTYRAWTFYFLTLILYQVIPCILLVKLGRLLLSSGRKVAVTESA